MTTATTLQKPTARRDVPAKVQPNPSQRGSRSIKEWCLFRHYSIGTFYEMKRRGVAPKVAQPPGAPPRITDEADAEWVKFCDNLPPDKAAEAAAIANERRTRTRKAAAKSAASPLHVSRRERA
jgi:hypothetical protein